MAGRVFTIFEVFYISNFFSVIFCRNWLTKLNNFLLFTPINKGISKGIEIRSSQLDIATTCVSWNQHVTGDKWLLAEKHCFVSGELQNFFYSKISYWGKLTIGLCFVVSLLQSYLRYELSLYYIIIDECIHQLFKLLMLCYCFTIWRTSELFLIHFYCTQILE